ncbi:helix-turn-helix transcriptional regulator [Nonomuraea phyllanthi]|nr:helix-turn-helix transcriptional regulator [Nonomuraea phyllanthi]
MKEADHEDDLSPETDRDPAGLSLARDEVGNSGALPPARRPVTAMLRGRRAEYEQLDELLDAVRRGGSRALVLRGEAGVGKTALLDHLAERAREFRVCRIAGVQPEMELVFAGLHQLCASMADGLARLAPPQRGALHAAFGLSADQVPDHFRVGLATLGLLAEAARDQPLLCLVDDVQWLDRASVQALAFAARRLRAESVAIVFAARVPDEASEPAGPQEPAVTGLPELAVTGLPDDAARELLRSVLPGPWDERVLDRIVAETRGNPLALLELPKDRTPIDLAGGFGLPGSRALTGRIQQVYQRRLLALPPQTRRLLLVAAAEPGGEPGLLWRAADRLSVGIEAATPAIAAGLVQIDHQVRFPHPLVRSAVYWAASPEERCRAHRALAEATDPRADPDRRAWHAAQGTRGPAEDVAAQLERSADRARARGGLAAAAAFLARAVELTPDPARRQERALAAARAAHHAGTPSAALRLLSIAEASPLDRSRRGRADLLRAQIAFATDRGADAPALLLKAAQQLEPHDVPLAREAYLEAISAALFAGPQATGCGQLEAAEAARSVPPPAGPARPADLLLDGLTALIGEGHAAGVPRLKPALAAFRADDLPSDEGLDWLWLAGTSAATSWDGETWDLLATRHLRLARESDQATALPLALTTRIAVDAFAGELTTAASLVEEVRTVSEAVGIPCPAYGALTVAAWRGHEADHAGLMKTVVAEAVRRGEGSALIVGGWTKALLGNSLGRYEDALSAAADAADHPHRDTSAAVGWALAEYVEAAVRSGEPERAADAFRRLRRLTGPSGTDWARGIEARSRALVSADPAAEAHYREAIDRLGRTAIRGELARAHLVYGEWLRRERRQRDAREQLRTAHEAFTAMGMEAFAERAERELLATGEQARRRTVETSGELTAQEAQIVRLVREGLTNPEIGTRIFISPRTVEWHLRNIFGKLGVTSRRQLQGAGSRA